MVEVWSAVGEFDSILSVETVGVVRGKTSISPIAPDQLPLFLSGFISIPRYQVYIPNNVAVSRGVVRVVWVGCNKVDISTR